MASSDVELLRGAWEAFARGDLNAAKESLDPAVRWYSVDDDEPRSGCNSQDQVLAFIRQAMADGVTAEAFDYHDAGDRVVVFVQTRHPAEWGHQPAPHGEVVTVRNGRIIEMVVYPSVVDALAAVGEPRL